MPDLPGSVILKVAALTMKGAAFAALLGLLAIAPAARAQAPADPTQAAFALVDTDGDGFVDEAELTRDMARSFAALDRDRDRMLVPGELADHDAAMFRAIDGDGDGRLAFAEVMRGKLQDFHAAGAGDGRLAIDEYMRSQGKL